MDHYEEAFNRKNKIDRAIKGFQTGCEGMTEILSLFTLIDPSNFTPCIFPLGVLFGITPFLVSKFLQISIIENYLKLPKDVRELQNLYGDYLGKMANVLKQHQLTHPFQIAALCTDLIKQGYFSKDFTFSIDSVNQYQHSLPFLTGPRVMSGTGVCRHISFMTEDFAAQFSVSMPVLIGSLAYPWQSRRKALHKNILHAVNLLEINGKKLAWDVTHEETYLFVSKNKMKSFDNKYKDLVFHIMPDQWKRCDRILSLPALKEEEYKEEVASSLIDASKIPYEELLAVHQSSLNELERICQIEESYSVPTVRKAKTLIK